MKLTQEIIKKLIREEMSKLYEWGESDGQSDRDDGRQVLEDDDE